LVYYLSADFHSYLYWSTKLRRTTNIVSKEIQLGSPPTSVPSKKFSRTGNAYDNITNSLAPERADMLKTIQT